jgi:hypothetical protein
MEAFFASTEKASATELASEIEEHRKPPWNSPSKA